MHIVREFLGWDLPIVKLAVKKLIGLWDGSTLDLSHILVVVPTKQSGRRLREGIARYAAQRNAGVLPPQTVTPDFFIRPENSPVKVATAIESTAAWAEVLMGVDLDNFISLFPKKPENQNDPKWALGLTEKISKLRTLLSENGLILKDVAGKCSELVEESERWIDMAGLEKLYLKKLSDAGLEDVHVAKIKYLAQNIDLTGIDRIIVLAVPDPTPFSLKAIEKAAGQMTVEVWIHAPENMTDSFDKWGRPVPSFWEKENIIFPEGKEFIRLRGDAQAQSDDVINILLEQQRALDVSEFAIAAPNANLLSYIEKSFMPYGVEVYDPAGESITLNSMFHLVKTMGDLCSNKQYDSWSALLRNSDMIRHISAKNRNFDPVRMLTQLDRFQNMHMPDSMKDISFFLDRYKDGAFEDLKSSHAEILTFIKLFEKSRPIEFVRSFLGEVYKNIKVDTSLWGNTKQSDTAQVINNVLEDMDSPVFGDLFMSSELQMEILFKVLKSKSIYPDHAERAVPIQGWLEMPWEDAEILIIAGMNEGFVPDSIVGDIFLPDLPREKLGVTNNSSRFARDSYLLTSMINSRPQGGVYCIVGKNDVSGDPLKPSRLLLRCSDEELLDRANMLFQEVSETEREIITPEHQWKLAPKLGGNVKHMSATAFKDYLKCPFRFYLKRVLKMEHIDDRKTEADAMEFGNACHIPLELFGKSEELRECQDPFVIAAFLQEQAEIFMKNKFGNDLPLALTVQLDTIKKRLGRVAEVEVQLRSDGWKTLETEYEIGGGEGVVINGMLIVGKIDRIDIRDGVIRIIDYKTSDSATDPLKAHVKRANDDTADYAFFEQDGKDKCWTDLQLPLYHVLLDMDPRFKKYEKHCGYFMIPKALEETGVSFWKELDADYLDHAKVCIDKVIDNICGEVFWPPAEKVAFDDFEGLHTGSLKDVVDISIFENVEVK